MATDKEIEALKRECKTLFASDSSFCEQLENVGTLSTRLDALAETYQGKLTELKNTQQLLNDTLESKPVDQQKVVKLKALIQKLASQLAAVDAKSAELVREFQALLSGIEGGERPGGEEFIIGPGAPAGESGARDAPGPMTKMSEKTRACVNRIKEWNTQVIKKVKQGQWAGVRSLDPIIAMMFLTQPGKEKLKAGDVQLLARDIADPITDDDDLNWIVQWFNSNPGTDIVPIITRPGGYTNIFDFSSDPSQYVKVEDTGQRNTLIGKGYAFTGRLGGLLDEIQVGNTKYRFVAGLANQPRMFGRLRSLIIRCPGMSGFYTFSKTQPAEKITFLAEQDLPQALKDINDKSMYFTVTYYERI